MELLERAGARETAYRTRLPGDRAPLQCIGQKAVDCRSARWISDHLRIRVAMDDEPPAIVAPEDLCHA